MARGGWGESTNRQTRRPGPQKVSVFRAAERQVSAFLADIFCVDQDMTRQFVLDPEAPALLIGCLVPAWRTNRTVGTEAHIVQQSERNPRGLFQPELKRIVQTDKRSCEVIGIDRDHICVLIETCAAIGDNTSDPGARLPVINAVASA